MHMYHTAVVLWLLCLFQISGVDAARTLLADLLSCTDAARGVGELALYWAARAKLEEVGGCTTDMLLSSLV